MMSICCIPLFEDLSLEQFGNMAIIVMDVEELVHTIGQNSKFCNSQFTKFKS